VPQIAGGFPFVAVGRYCDFLLRFAVLAESFAEGEGVPCGVVGAIVRGIAANGWRLHRLALVPQLCSPTI
jgi:hypothetical protein